MKIWLYCYFAVQNLWGYVIKMNTEVNGSQNLCAHNCDIKSIDIDGSHNKIHCIHFS